MTWTEFLRAHLHAALAERAALPKVASMPDLTELRRTEWSTRFEERCRARLIMGAFRYGRLHAPGKPTYDRVASMRKRLAAYEATGNTEHLVDVANLALLEFEEGTHPRKHFCACDDGPHAMEVGLTSDL